MKKFILLLTLLSLLWWIGENLNYKVIPLEKNIDTLLHNKVDKAFLEKSITKSLQNQNYEEAKRYISLANFLHISLPAKLLQDVEELNSFSYKVKRFSSGFFSGKASDDVSLVGAVSSDFTIVGDLRDLSVEGEKYLENKPYDKFLLGISGVGVALGISTIATMGASSPLKATTSVLKVAKKSGKLTKSFTKVLEKKLAKSYDKRVLKSVNWSDVRSIKRAVKTIDTKPLQAILKQLQKIRKNSSLGDTIALMKYVDDEKDLQKVVKISQKYKKNTRVILKILGKGVLKGSKKVLKLADKALVAVGLAFVNIVLLLS